MKALATTLAPIMMIVWPAVGQAQTAVLTPAQRAEVTGAKLSSVVDPTRTTTSSPQPIFTVEATTGDSIGTASIGWQYGALTFDAKASGPINRATGEALFADLDGLRNQANIDLGVQYAYWNVTDPVSMLLPACRKLAALQHVDVKTVDCSLSNLRAQQRALGVALIPYVDPGTVLLFGTRYKVGRKGFDYVDPSNLSEQSALRTGWSYAVGTAVITPTNLLVGGGYRREVRFNPGSDPVQLCRPLNIGGSSACAEAVLGGPVRLESNQLYFEMRKFLGPVAVSPRLSRDFTRHVTGLDVPLYFLKNTDGGFTGGVRVGWRSDRTGMTVVAFVGNVLGLLAVP